MPTTSPAWYGHPTHSQTLYTSATNTTSSFYVEYEKLNLLMSSVLNRLTDIEERMGMLERNLLLETRYKELKELGEKYKQLEKDLLEKEKIVEILKK